jgi:hypothetical protein
MRMRFVVELILFAGIICLATPPSVLADQVQYQVSNVSGNEWQYSYYISNPPLNSLLNLQAFTVFFDPSLTTNLQDTSGESTPNWGIFSIPYDPVLGSDGFYTAQALTDNPLTDPFTITFDYLGSGTPGSQFFSIDQFDANGNLTSNLGIGDTTLLPSAETPEPGTLVLYLSGLVGLLGISNVRKRIRGTTSRRAWARPAPDCSQVS